MRLVRVVSLLVLVACGAGAAQAQPSPAAAPSTLLDRLYRIIWPAGRFEGDLAALVAQHTQKAGGVPELPRLYLVDVQSRTATEWRSARGALDPVYCAAQGLLLYRRGAAVVAESVRTLPDALEASSPPRLLAGVDVRHLYACVSGERAEPVAVAADTQGVVRGLRVDDQPGWVDLTGDLAGATDADALDKLQILRGVRPDGFAVSVSNHRLVGERKEAPERFVVVASDLAFFGYPAWAGATRFLFVNGSPPVR